MAFICHTAFTTEGDTLHCMNAVHPWRTVPRRSKITFLLAVFFVFAIIGFANDTMDMGRLAPFNFGLGVVLPGLFAIGYAFAGVTLRSQWWKAFVPIFVVQFVAMGALDKLLPDPPPLAQMGKHELEILHSRLTFDGIAMIIAVSLGYTGFIYVFISEGKRYLRTRTEMATLEGEMAAAREVQRLMVPEHPPQVGGYSIESVYHPAAEVGGDFFQVIATADGAALIALGDVSGKGLKAAMTVSLIVGALRTMADYTQSPAAILQGLNRRLLGRTDGGFVTCVIARIDPSGATTLANAGHLAPYRAGQELPVNGSLPLGLAADAVYDELVFLLHEGETLTFYTDGILEARNPAGELYGFDRVTALVGSDRTIEQMVEEARNFGQQDDITVFRVTRLAQSAPANAARLSMATQIAGA